MAIFKPKVWHPVAKHGSTKQEEIHITKKEFAASFRFLSSLQGSVHFKVLFRSALPYFVTGWQIASLKIAASGARALLAMTNLVGFSGKRYSFLNEMFEKRCVATPRKKGRIKQKATVSKTKALQICVIARSAATWQSLSQRYGIPQRSTGARSKKEALSQKTWIHCFVSLPLSFRVLLRSVQPYFVPGCRFVPFKIAASLSLLAMTNLVGFAEKRNNFRNEKVSITAEFHCAASASAVPAGASTSGLSSAVSSVASFAEVEVSASGGASRRRGRPSASKNSS